MIAPAQFYHNQNLSIIPCKNKQPLVKAWKEYQSAPIKFEDLHNFFNSSTPQIAIITGAVSQGLELLDFDLKVLPEDQRQPFWEAFQHALLELSSDVFRSVQINKTASGGYHIIYRSEIIEGNKKLAKVLNKETNKYECIIETRGEGGYFIAPPSIGYEFIHGNFTNIPVLDADEREALINLCKSFNEEPLQTPKAVNSISKIDTSYLESPFESYNASNDCLALLESYGWEFVEEKGERVYYKRPGATNHQSGNWHKSRRLFYVWTSNDQFFEAGKAYNPAMIFNTLECKGDWKRCYKALIMAGYGKKFSEEHWHSIEETRQKLKAGLTPIDAKESLIKSKPDWLEFAQKIVDAALKSENEFWFFDKQDLKISKLLFLEFLHRELGYALYANSNEKRKPLVKFYDDIHQVARIDTNDFVKKNVLDWLTENVEDSFLRDQIIQALLNQSDKLFNEKNYEWLPPVNFKTFSDTKDHAYFFFKNGIVRVSVNKIDLIEYTDIPSGHFIWTERIKNKDFDIEILRDDESIYLQSTWAKFIRRISAILPEHDNSTISSLDEKLKNRFLANMTATGYLLHRYKDPAKPWAIIIQEDTPLDVDGGGSGKQIINNALKTLRNVMEEDGKQLDVSKQFAFQSITDDTDIYILDDVKKSFKIEPMYRMISNDMMVEIRNVGRKLIPYDRSPKMAFTTNYDLVSTDANHLSRRIKLLLVHCYFGPNRLPKDELGMLLGDDWDRDQWLLFYNFMFNCTMLYLNSSIIDVVKTEAMKEKGIRVNYGDDFFDFASGIISDSKDGIFIPKILYDEFLEAYKIDKRFFGYGKFRNGFLAILKIYNFETEIEKNFRDRTSGADSLFGRTIDKQLAILVKNWGITS